MLQKATCDELKMRVALHGYSPIRGGFGMKLDHQHKKIESFYHGTKTQPSQIKLLVKSHIVLKKLKSKKIKCTKSTRKNL